MRINMVDLLADPVKRKELMIRVIMATQAREGVETTREQAEVAYDKVQSKKGIDFPEYEHEDERQTAFLKRNSYLGIK